MRRWWTVSAACSCTMVCQLAFADAAPVVRQQLLADAYAARVSGDHRLALNKARQAAAIRLSGSLSRFIAEEYDALNQPARAYAEADRCRGLALEMEPGDNRRAVAEGCRLLVARLQSRVGIVTVRLAPALARATISFPAARALRARRRWVSRPGVASVLVRTADGAVISKDVTVTAGGRHLVKVDRPASGPARRDPKTRTPPPTSVKRDTSRSTLPILLVGGGLSAIAAATATYLSSTQRFSDLRSECESGRCPADRDDRRQQIETLDVISLVLAGVGAASVGFGMTLAVLPASNSADSSARWIVRF